MSSFYNKLLEMLDKEIPVASEKKDYFLFFQGTNHKFDQHSGEKYPQGETISFLAKLSAGLYDKETGDINKDAARPDSESYAHAYSSPSVDVLNGPDTRGNEIADRLAKGLLLALTAVAQGKTNLHVSGFSRGAAQAIVLMHELDRVRKALEEDAEKETTQQRSLVKIIQDTSSVQKNIIRESCKEALQRLTSEPPAAEIAENARKAKLLLHLQNIQVKLFALDPVPGGNFAKLPTGWYEDGHFSRSPAFVKDAYVCVQMHENSNCFKVIIPRNMPYEFVTGNHGTGDGNQYANDGSEIPKSIEKRDVSGAQDLVVCRWLELMFPEKREIALSIDLELQHPHLQEVVQKFLSANDKGRTEQLLEIYTYIQENYPGYLYLASRTFPTGRYSTERQVYYGARSDTPVSYLNANREGTSFINRQHVECWIASNIQTFDFHNKPLLAQVEWLSDEITKIFSPAGSNPQAEDTSSWTAKVFKNEENRHLLYDALSLLLNTATQTYLRNPLNEEDKNAYKTCIENTFKKLDPKKDTEETSNDTEAKNFGQRIRNNLSSILIQYQSSLFSQAEKLRKEQQILIADTPSEENQNNEVTPSAWLAVTQKLYADLGELLEKTDNLKDGCDDNKLMQRWEIMLPDFQPKVFDQVLVSDSFINIEPEPDDAAKFKSCKERLKNLIEAQRALLKQKAIELVKHCPNLITQESLANTFYQSVYLSANCEKFKEKIRTQEKNIQQQTKEIQDLKKRLDCPPSGEERLAIIKIYRLLPICEAYQCHLQQKKDGSDLWTTKNGAVTEMIEILKDDTLLPTDQLKNFIDRMETRKEDLRKHRDPGWQRFIRDCWRVFAFFVFPKMTFFRISQGQEFLNDVEHETELQISR